MEVTAVALEAVTAQQRQSLAELPRRKKYALYESVSLEDRSVFHKVSCRPITKAAEDDMELLSDIVTWGELYLHEWRKGSYCCSRCFRVLYLSSDKWRGPCVWPSFRRPANENALSTTIVYPYNNYTCEVREVYCGGCDLFLGHQFEDAVRHGDTHPLARHRH